MPEATPRAFATRRIRRNLLSPVAVLGAIAIFVTALHAPQVAARSDKIMASNSRPNVVLLHGLGRTSRSMNKMAEALTQAGYRVNNIGYPSRNHEFEPLLGLVDKALEACCVDDGARINFVTHSLGGILLRAWAERRGVADIGRVVMLSPPNQGSELVDKLKDIFLFKWIAGPVGQQLGTDTGSVQSELGPVRFELGVITGSSSFNPFYSWLIPGEDDGKVAVERAKVDGMADFLVLPHSHSFIMNSDEVIRQTLFFFDHGRFHH